MNHFGRSNKKKTYFSGHSSPCFFNRYNVIRLNHKQHYEVKKPFGHSIALVKKQNYVMKCHFLVESKEYGQVCFGFGHSEGPAINYSEI